MILYFNYLSIGINWNHFTTMSRGMDEYQKLEHFVLRRTSESQLPSAKYTSHKTGAT